MKLSENDVYKPMLERIQQLEIKLNEIYKKYEEQLERCKKYSENYMYEPETFRKKLSLVGKTHKAAFCIQTVNSLEDEFNKQNKKRIECVLSNPEMEHLKEYLKLSGKTWVSCTLEGENVTFEIMKEHCEGLESWMKYTGRICNTIENSLRDMEEDER